MDVVIANCLLANNICCMAMIGKDCPFMAANLRRRFFRNSGGLSRFGDLLPQGQAPTLPQVLSLLTVKTVYAVLTISTVYAVLGSQVVTAKIITVANQKGGSGKTTVAMQLAGTLAKRGNKVLVIDADQQGTATRWAASADDEKPFPAPVVGLNAAGAKVHREARKFVEDYDFLIIDCPPAVDSPVPQSALLVSDLVLVPVIPSPADLWAATGIQQLITNAQDINETMEARLVANMCQPQTTLARDALDVLEDFGIPLADSRLHLRTVYRQSAVYGGTVHDLGTRAAQAVAEIDSLTDDVVEILHPSQKAAEA